MQVLLTLLQLSTRYFSSIYTDVLLKVSLYATTYLVIHQQRLTTCYELLITYYPNHSFNSMKVSTYISSLAMNT